MGWMGGWVVVVVVVVVVALVMVVGRWRGRAGQGSAEKTAPSDINFCQQTAVPKNVVAVGWNRMRSAVV